MSMCPHCRHDAPIVMQGAKPLCTVCGKPRLPFSTRIVNLAGQPSQVGGALTKMGGILLLVMGLVFALLIGALLQAIFTATIIGWVFGGVLAAAVIMGAAALLKGGSMLQRHGVARQGEVRDDALRTFAATHAGVINADEAAGILAVEPEVADEALMRLARKGEGVTVECDAEGRVYYRFVTAAEGTNARRVRVEAPRRPMSPAPTRIADEFDELLDEPATLRSHQKRKSYA